MNAKSLRIGNYILDVQDGKPYPVTIETLYEILSGMDYFVPIPLTEEWLLKFGFEKMGDKFSLKNKKAGVFRFVKISGNIIVGELEHGRNSISEFIKYVHQLQNLYFALTGEELNVSELI